MDLFEALEKGLLFSDMEHVNRKVDPVREVENLMRFNRYWDAYSKLNNMIKEKKDDIKLYRLRAQCTLRMTMPTECINDCSQIMKMKPSNDDLRFALTTRAQAHLQTGNFEAAMKDAKSANERKVLQSINDAIRISKSIENFMNNGQVAESKRYLDQILRVCPKASNYLLMRSDIAWLEGDHAKYEELTNEITGEQAKDPKMNYRRAVINLCKNKLDDSKKLLKVSMKSKNAPKNASIAMKTIENIISYRKSAEISLKKNDTEKAEIYINNTIDSTKQFCPVESSLVQSTNLLQIQLLKLKNDKQQAIKVLDEMILHHPTEELHLERGDIHLELGDYEAAIFDYNSVHSQNPQNRRAAEGLKKANDMKKEANYVDYYKILNITKTASSADIKSAYRKMVIKWHPDRYSDKEAKKEAESMMKKINTAYEILSDPKRKDLYDRGIDPDDPMSGGGSPFGEGFNPFGEGFNPFGDGFPFGEGFNPFGDGFNPFDFGEDNGHGGRTIHIEFHNF